MNTQLNMKKLLLVLITGCLLATGCAELLRDELADVHNQIEDIRDELELLKEQMNTNIGALRVLVEGLQSEDFIKSVVPITEGSKVIGYTITFTKSQPITIYHGQDGKDGEDGKDGKDGTTPVIGVKQDNDGAWYWTIDGAWLLDGNGNKVRAEAKDGANGKDGTDGTDGKDGKTPKLKIEDGYWYISVDDGVSWEKLGQATGNPGAPGDSMFSSIDVSDPNKVIFTLQDGTVIVFPTWESFSALQQQVFILNTNLSGLEGIVNALQSQDYITSVVPLVENMLIIGYTINFKKSESITIYHGKAGKDGKDGIDGKDGKDGTDGTDGKDGKDGKDGSTPVIGVKQYEDGVWYWTIDGEWMTDSAGKKVRASAKDGADGTNGVTPQLKIEEGYWYLSLDNGETWKKLGMVIGYSGGTGDSIIKAIDTSDDAFVVLTLADDSKLIIPRFQPITITIGNGQQRIGISANETISLDYSLSYGDNKTIVAVATDGQYTATIKKTDDTHGTLTVSCPLQFVEGTVNVLVYDGNGYMTLSVLEFYEKEMTFSSGTQFSLDVDGGVLEIPYTTNFAFQFVLDNDASWMTVTDEKAGETSGKLVVNVPKNNGGARTGHIIIYPMFGTDKAFATITINQASSYYAIDYSTFLAESKGGEFLSTITTSRGVNVSIPSGVDWVSYEMSNSGDQYKVKFTVAANTMTSRRDVTIDIYATDGTSERLGVIQIGQLPASADLSKMMIFEVRANVANQFEIYLPLAGELDCYIDWGDGSTEYYRGKYNMPMYEEVCHQYAYGITSNYEVRISGSVTQLSSDRIPYSKKQGIIEVKQWGNTGLTYLNNAFKGLRSLKRIPSDNVGAFSNVWIFKGVFADCEALSSIPDDLLKYGKNIQGMEDAFSNCTALEAIPENLFSECISVENIDGIFAGCTGIKTIPENLFSSMGEVLSASGLFSGCTSITNVPERLFSSFSKVGAYKRLFKGCTNLASIPEKLFASSPEVGEFDGVFRDCQALTFVPEGLFMNNTKVWSFREAFSGTSIVSIPEKLFYYCPSVSIFCHVFEGVNKLKSVPVSVFDNNRLIERLEYCFSGCSQIEGESPYTIVDGQKVHLYERYKYPDFFVTPLTYEACFWGASFLDSIYIPDEWK